MNFQPVELLNARAIPNRYPLHHIEDSAHILWGKQVFSKIDLVHAYNQIPVAEDDIPKTAITTHFRLFEFPYRVLAYAILCRHFNVLSMKSFWDLISASPV